MTDENLHGLSTSRQDLATNAFAAPFRPFPARRPLEKCFEHIHLIIRKPIIDIQQPFGQWNTVKDVPSMTELRLICAEIVLRVVVLSEELRDVPLSTREFPYTRI